MIYETERLVVRRWRDTPEDLDRIFDIYRREEVTKWLGMPKPMEDPEQAGRAQQRWTAKYPDDRYGLWAVEVKESGLIAGSLLLVPLPDPNDGEPSRGEVEVGWHLHPDSWGHGYATESARGALAHGFANGLPEIQAIAFPDNGPSLAVMRRLGMIRLGRTKRWYDFESEWFVARP